MTYDIIIAGSGGGGMIAALKAFDLGLKPLIIEKSDFYGGSTALSGGGVWVPGSRHLQDDGVNDSAEEAILYMQETVGNGSSSERQRAYVEKGAEMIDYVEAFTHLKFHRIPVYADYYPDLPGGKPEGRTLEPIPFNGSLLGKLKKELNPPIWSMIEKFPVTGKEFHKIAMMKSTSAGKKALLKIIGRILKDKLTGRKTMTLGQALVAALRLSLEDRGIPLWLETGLKDLIIEDEKVVGAVIERNGSTEEIRAHHGVLLATGGFGRNQEMRDKYQPAPVKAEWSLASKCNNGDGINVGLRYKADLGMMEDAWWGPVSILPDKTPFFHVAERAQPGGILVNKKGNRFIN